MESRTFPLYFTSVDIAKAEKAAKKAIPRVINITNYKPDEINICLIGCQGSGKPSQSLVADLMNQVGEKYPLTFIFYLGDNFYPSGAQTPIDSCFDNQFHSIYEHPSRPYINKKPGAIVEGNHCAGRDTLTEKKSKLSYFYNLKRGEEAERQQVAHSRLMYDSEIFDKNEVDYEKLPPFFLPSLFYSLVIENLQIFILDSNTYVYDYLEYLKDYSENKKIDREKNQAAWFKKEYKIARDNKKTIFVAMHHPVYTVDKRNYSYHFDAKHYLDDNAITRFQYINDAALKDETILKNKEKLKAIFNMKFDSTLENANYNHMINQTILVHQKIIPDLFLVAHSHNINYVENKKSNIDNKKIIDNKKLNKIIFPPRQLTNGGGGDESLQARLFFKKGKILKGFFKKNGCSVISLNKYQPERFDIHLFTIDGCHLKFNSQSDGPIQEDITDEKVKNIRDIVLTTCHQYEKFLHKKQTKTNGGTFDRFTTQKSYNPISVTLTLFKHNFIDYMPTYQDVDIMHDIINFLNQPSLPDYYKVLRFIHEKINQISYKEIEKSLYSKINLAIQKEEEFKDKTIDMLYQEESLNHSFHMI